MNAAAPRGRVIAAVLAGGASRRMGGPTPKALVPLGATTLLDRVLSRLGPQVDETWLSVSDPAPFAGFPLRCVPDGAPRRRGPLAGLGAALARLAEHDAAEWLLLAPCDAPFLPADLARRLLEAASQADASVAVARSGGVLQPTFSLWRRDMRPYVERLLGEATRPGLRHAFEGLEVAVVDWHETEPPPFFNVNTPADLARAGRWLDAAGADIG